MRSTAKRTSMIGLAAGLALFFAACSSSAATVTPTTTTAVAGATETPAATTGMASQSAVATSGAASVVIGSANDASLGSYLTGPGWGDGNVRDNHPCRRHGSGHLQPSAAVLLRWG